MRRLDEVGDEPQQRRLAAARRPDQADELAGRDARSTSTSASTWRVVPGLKTLRRRRRRIDRPARVISASSAGRGRLRISTDRRCATTPAIESPRTPAPNERGVHLGRDRRSPGGSTRGSGGRCRRARPVEISATTTPITDAGGGQLERRHDVRHGAREAQLAHRLRARGGEAAHQLERRRPTPTPARAACRRRPGRRRGTRRARRPTATAATPTRRGASLPPQLTTSGARAISGTVCDTTRYGSRPRRTMPKRAITAASADADGGAEHEAGERRAGTSTTRRRARPARSWRSDVRLSVVEQALAHLPHVGHRGVVGPGQDAHAEHLAAVLGPDHLVELPRRRPRARARGGTAGPCGSRLRRRRARRGPG